MNIKPKAPWYENLLTTMVLSYLGTLSFAKACTEISRPMTPHWLALGMMCIAITVQRLVHIARKYG